MHLGGIATASLFFLGLSLPVKAAPVVNHSFETGDYTGWTQFDNTSFSPVVGPVFGTFFPTDGNFQASFGPQGSTGGITQDIVTTPGTTYEIAFDLFNFGGTPSSFSVDFGGVAGPTLTNPGVLGYTTFSFSALTMSALTPLTFTFQHDPNFWLLDNIAVNDPTPAGVPELDGASVGAPLALLSMGLLLAGDRRRRFTCSGLRSEGSR